MAAVAAPPITVQAHSSHPAITNAIIFIGKKLTNVQLNYPDGKIQKKATLIFRKNAATNATYLKMENGVQEIQQNAFPV